MFGSMWWQVGYLSSSSSPVCVSLTNSTSVYIVYPESAARNRFLYYGKKKWSIRAKKNSYSKNQTNSPPNKQDLNNQKQIVQGTLFCPFVTMLETSFGTFTCLMSVWLCEKHMKNRGCQHSGMKVRKSWTIMD